MPERRLLYLTQHQMLAYRWQGGNCLPEGDFAGHTFHYSKANIPLNTLTTLAHASPLPARPDGNPGEAVYRRQRLTASYLHLYFPSNPVGVAALLGS